MKIADKTVVQMHYTLTSDEGKVIDSSAGREPLQYIQGAHMIVVGLEKASAETVAYIVKTVIEKDIKTVYTIELSDGRLADVVAEKTGAEVKTFYTGHNVSLEDFEKKVTYIDLLYRDLDVIR